MILFEIYLTHIFQCKVRLAEVLGLVLSHNVHTFYVLVI